MKTKIYAALLFLTCVVSYGQLRNYDNKIALTGIMDQWHTVTLPNALFANLQNDLADIRIYGVTKTDTLEAPYVLKVSDAKGALSKINFKLINSASNQKGYYFTYEVPTTKPINEIRLNINNKNFDWNVVLEGSQDQKEWFTLLDDNRILSIKNDQTDYAFTRLKFPNAKYRYYRLLVKSSVRPELVSTTLYLDSILPATHQEYLISDFKVTEANKNTILSVDLKSRLPISHVRLSVSDKVDYYRPIEIQYVSDSAKTEKGWRYGYRTLTKGTLSSLEKNEFSFNSTLAKKLKIIIHNYDNQPLTFSTPLVKGYLHELVARFDKPASYYLVYGKEDALTPNYDIVSAGFDLPKNTKELTLGPPETIPKRRAPKAPPLF